MAYKFDFVFLGFACLMPAFYAAPSTSLQIWTEENTDKSFLERIKLTALFLIEFSVLNEEILRESPKIFNKVLRDSDVLEVKTETMANITKGLKDYMDQLEKSKESNDTRISELIERYSNIIDEFDSKKTESLSPEAAIIKKSLQKNGLADIEKSIHARYKIFFVKFSNEIDQYLKGLNEKEKENEKDLIIWHEKLKDEQNIDKKIEALKNLPLWGSD